VTNKKRKIKVVHLLYSLGVGGIETMVVNILNEQILNLDSTLMIINDLFDGEVLKRIDKQISVVRIGRRPGSRSLWPILKLHYELLKIQPDVIHMHSANICRFVLPALLRANFCATMHSVCLTDNPNAPFLSRFQRVFAISQAVQQTIAQQTGVKATVVLNGIPISSFRAAIKNKNNHGFRMVQISRLFHTQKGQHLLIQALSELKRQGFDAVSLDLIGEGESLAFLKRLVNELSLKKEVHFLGEKPQEYIFQHLCDYDLLVQPSLYEGFGLTVVEAMAARIPVLVSANEGPFEIIGQGKYGFYFKNGDFLDCAEKIKKIMTEGVPSGMLELAHERAQTLYNVNRTAQRYLEEYRKILERCPRGFFRSRGKRG